MVTLVLKESERKAKSCQCTKFDCFLILTKCLYFQTGNDYAGCCTGIKKD